MNKNNFNKQNILINFRGGIGDFILLTPVLRNIVKEGRSNLFLIGNKSIKSLADGYLYFKGCFYIDEAAGWREKIIELRKIFELLKSFKMDICISPICSYGKLNSLIAFFSRASIRIAFLHGRLAPVINNVCIPITYQESDLEQNLKILSCLNVKSAFNRTEFFIPNKSKERVEDFFRKKGIAGNSVIICIAPFSKGVKGHTSKEWQIQKYIDLIRRISRLYNVKFIIMGSPEELLTIEKISDISIFENVIHEDREFSVYEAAAILERSSMLICNDNGLMHVAASIDVPVISIWGPTSPKRWGYLEKMNFIAVWLNNCVCCREYKKPMFKCNHQKCLEGISVNKVFNMVSQYLDNKV